MVLEVRSTAVCDDPEEFSSVNLAVRAGESCIAGFSQDRGEIDLLINIGVYRDRNIIEPAMSSLIQRELRLNNDPLATDMEKTTFSFDLVNGPPSFINALEIIDSMMITGAAKNAMIVSSDAHPSRSGHRDFPFRNFGAAMILSRNSRPGEPTRFFHKTSQNGYRGVEGHLSFQKNAQNILQVDVAEDYPERLLAFAIDAAREGIDTGQLDLAGVKAVITSQPCAGFGRALAKGAGLSGGLAMDTFGEFGDTHSSALILGYHLAIENRRIAPGDRVVFVGAGSGLSVGCCVM